MWGTWHIISPPAEKVGGYVRLVPHLITPMMSRTHPVTYLLDCYFCLLSHRTLDSAFVFANTQPFSHLCKVGKTHASLFREYV